MKDSAIDRYILRQSGSLSVTEMSKETGLSKEELAERRQKLFDEVSVLSVNQRRTQLIMKLAEGYDEIFKRISSAEDKLVAGMVNAGTNALKVQLKELREMEKQDRSEVEAANRALKEQLLSIVEKAGDRTIGALAERFPELSVDDIEAEFRANVLQVAREFDED